MHTLTFGYRGRLSPDYNKVGEAARLVKSDATPVGVGIYSTNPSDPRSVPQFYISTAGEYYQDLNNTNPQGGHIMTLLSKQVSGFIVD